MAGLSLAAEPPVRPADRIKDNSFLLEEAYNQEAGVVQHIFNFTWFANERGAADDRALSMVFTQEWPLFSQTHQISYTVPFTYLESGGSREHGVGDIMLNYRLQALMESDTLPAIAPRLSLIFPTGDDDKGLGTGKAGYQFNLPLSKVVADRWTVHANAGLTYFPNVHGEDLLSYNLGASVIYAASDNLNLMLEVVANWNEASSDRGTDHSTTVLVSPGVRYAFNLPRDLQIVVGCAVPIGVTDDAPDYGVFLYLSIEHPFK